MALETTPPTPPDSKLVYPAVREVQNPTPLQAAASWLKAMNATRPNANANIL